MKKFLLYISAFVPLYLLLLIKISVQIIFHNISLNILNTLCISMLCLLIGMGTLGLVINLGGKKSQNIYVIEAKNITEKHFLGYFSLFVLFALGYQIEYVSMAIIFVIILVFIGIVYIRNNLFYINPLLNLIGYSFYSVQYKLDGKPKVYTETMIYFGKLKSGVVARAEINTYNFNVIVK